jgi:hypothetical protein
MINTRSSGRFSADSAARSGGNRTGNRQTKLNSALTRSGRAQYIAAILIGALFVLIYRGPLWPIVRSYLGDWLIVQLIFLIASIWVRERWHVFLAGAILMIGILTELIQLLGTDLIPHNFIAEITIGSTFDPLDVIAYTLGLATVLGINRYFRTRQHS